MKTLFKSTVLIACVSALLLANACNRQNESSAQRSDEVNIPDIDIHSAVLADNIEVVKQHIAGGTDINSKDPFGGSSPLTSAAVFGKTEIAKILLEAGADVNLTNNEGSTALHSAAFFCHTDIVQLLLDYDADKSIKNIYGQTPYESVAGQFSEVKPAYESLGTMLEPMGLKIDLDYLEKTRPQIAAMLK